MKTIRCIVCVLLIQLLSQPLAAQDSLATARLKSMRGVVAPFEVTAKKDSIFLICFWSVENEESINQLNALKSQVENNTGTSYYRFFAVSVDEGKKINRVRPTVNMNEWTFEVYSDLFGDLRRSLHSNNLPQSFIISKGRIVYQQSGWEAGSEKYLFERLAGIKKSAR